MNSSRRQFLKMLGTGALASVPLATVLCSRQTKRPNILFIMSDDHAEAAISCYGSVMIKTPNIDRIADEGMRFENSFVTNSICAPSRAVMLTGKYSHMNGLRDNRDEFDGSQLTFPKLFQQAGYQTGIVGKWHLKTRPTGFDNYKVLIDQGEYYNPVILENGKEKQHTGYTTDIITDMAIDALDNRDTSTPFCLLVHHKAPHRNWMPHPKYMRAFDGVDIPLPETFRDQYKGRPAAEHADMRIDDMYLSHDFKLHKETYGIETGSGGNADFAANASQNWANQYERLTAEQKKAWDAYYDAVNDDYKTANRKGDDLSHWKFQRYVKDYLACILSIDEGIGKILNYLDEHDLAKNTLVVYTSDQGFYLGEHGWYDKRWMYEESLSMPLVMRYPAEMTAGTVNENIVLNLDFAPTFLDLAGIATPDEMQGRSLKPLFGTEKNDDWRTSMYYHYYEYPHGWHLVHKHYGIRTERYKLIHFYGELDTWELYDLQEDVNELNNLYEDESYAALTKELKTELARLQEQFNDKSFVD